MPVTQQSVVQYAAMPTHDLVDQFQQVWAESRDEIENDSLQTLEPMITSLISRLIGKVETETYQKSWATGKDFQKDLTQRASQQRQ